MNQRDLYGGVCDRCGEDGTADDPVAEWVNDETSVSVGPERFPLAHGQCGEDAGWRLA